jgi:UDP-glucose 4-epimerase
MNPTRHEQSTLITGGAGFIGSHLAELLTRGGRHVTVVDNLSTGRRSNLDAVNPALLHFIEADVEHALPALDPNEFREIYHLAAAVGVRLVIEQPVRTIRTNIFDTLAVLEFAARGRIPTLLASTSEVYGKSARMPFSEDDDVVYGPTIFSRWSYACSKAIDEYLGLAFSKQRDVPVVIARFFNTIGPRQVGRYGMVVPRFVEAALAGRALEVHGDGRQSRCFCDVRDVVTALPALLGTRASHGRVFNVGHDRPIEIAALAQLVVATLHAKSPIEFVPYGEAFGEGFDDLRHRQPDLARLRSAIGFEPIISLEETIRDIAAEMGARGRALVENAST